MVARLNLPPGPKSGILALDFVNQMKADSLATALNLKSEFGDFVHIKSGPVHWFMFNHPDEPVLEKRWRYQKFPLFSLLY